MWPTLARAGYDIYRDSLNTPGFFEVLPDVTGLHGIDIGCGEGYNTRLLANRCARVTAVDIAEDFVAYAIEAEEAAPLGNRLSCGRCRRRFPLPDETFDFATAFMMLMDLPETERALGEAFRVLKPGGFLQFSITHPCFDTPQRSQPSQLGGPDLCDRKLVTISAHSTVR